MCPYFSLTSVAAFHYLVAGCPDLLGQFDPAGEIVNLIASRAERPVTPIYKEREKWRRQYLFTSD